MKDLANYRLWPLADITIVLIPCPLLGNGGQPSNSVKCLLMTLSGHVGVSAQGARTVLWHATSARSCATPAATEQHASEVKNRRHAFLADSFLSSA